MSLIGSRVRQLISRSSGNNSATRSVNSATQINSGIVRATDISFTAGGTIASAGNAFGNYRAGNTIEVVGSPLNSRTYVIDTAAAGSLTVLPAIIQTESAGALIEIRSV